MLLRTLLCIPDSRRQERSRELLERRTLVSLAHDQPELWRRLHRDSFDLAIVSTAALGERLLSSIRALAAVAGGPPLVLITQGEAVKTNAYVASPVSFPRGCL